MRVLFLGLFFDEEGLQQSYKEVKGGVQMAPHRFQTLLIKGLEENGVEVTCVHAMPCGTFPVHHRRLFIKDKRWGKENYRIGCLNLPFFKQRIQAQKAYRYLKKILSGENPPEIILTYYVHLPFWKGLQR
ncbi:MAG: hypothetical protein IJX18_01595 [Clostridia bacterium]|nr:hypothetical protein [Clostridia bacterium]